ncbi:LOW QUALITY PROTEIN: nuclear pore complex protein Nup50 [Coregonus clupeaformis]|uniref:LOW QUALITY PROTEIN: nuclear pore complex protein Nup50 n=1 Tax=Coregonus clupeaformis TaxID=59861 RepID=UPI001E1C5084|nr:LOW QUALITY PROTEIN: nuclear pore complex protein Nup50 [Coregonus clupeaformis]
MAKRIADKELTDRNWDQEDEGEEQAGTFSIASDDVMKSRPIKKAKRRAAGSEGQSGGSFKGFKGFSWPLRRNPGQPRGITAFSGFGNGAGFKLSNGNSVTPVTPAFTGFASPAATKTTTPGSLTFSGPPSSGDITEQQPNGSSPVVSSLSLSSGSCTSSDNQEYRKQLTALNCSVRDWITKHVNRNPLCDLNPIFRDYEKHLASIDKKYGGAGGSGAGTGGSASGSKAAAPEEKQPAGTTPPSSSSTAGSAATAPLFSFSKDKDGTTPASEKSSSAAPAPLPAGISFNLGQKALSSGGSPNVSFSSSSSSSSLFGGTSLPSFSFSGAKAEAVPTQTTEENGEESDEPPKVEVQEIKESDAFYSKKCKLFYKKETEFKEKGVGTLHLKTTPEGKTQLIVRADTNLGNILLNIMVQASIPCSRMGKNNVMVVCVPNPVVDHSNPTNPVAMLIRVKTAEDADELHNILEEKKV